VPAGTNLTGIRLQGNKQKIFYQGIREIKTQALEPRVPTSHKLTEVRESLKRLQGRVFTDEEIWCSIRNKDFLPRTAQFLWRAIHNAHRVGNYWKHIPECEDRAICSECGEVETLEHILVDCESPGPAIIWKAAETLWREKEPEWPVISLGNILGCGLMRFEDKRGRLKSGTRRLYRILVSESAYTIWKLRNDRVISRAGTRLTEKEIINKWTYDLNQHLQQDVILANRSAKRNHPRLDPDLVKDTWAGTLDNEGKLPDNWLKESRVLVGRRALTQNQLRNRESDGVG
jgi:ribonuclease HI